LLTRWCQYPQLLGGPLRRDYPQWRSLTAQKAAATFIAKEEQHPEETPVSVFSAAAQPHLRRDGKMDPGLS